jgi:hypothetical protein
MATDRVILVTRDEQRIVRPLVDEETYYVVPERIGWLNRAKFNPVGLVAWRSGEEIIPRLHLDWSLCGFGVTRRLLDAEF